jgi:antibiotic biosynthesis monooxygenase (ABM) superfamily enzyme
MLNLKVKYFLNPEGIAYFPAWYAEVYKEASQQSGFIKMRYESAGNTFTVFLSFLNEKSLESWASTVKHDEFVAQIEAHFIKPEEVEYL